MNGVDTVNISTPSIVRDDGSFLFIASTVIGMFPGAYQVLPRNCRKKAIALKTTL